MSDTVRTRYAPSPTGFMHVGNLRTALYEYLVSKSQGGKLFLELRIQTKNARLREQLTLFIEHSKEPDLNTMKALM
mgnify:FL=1